MDEQLAQVRADRTMTWDTMTSSDGGVTVRVERATRDPDWPVKKDALQGALDKVSHAGYRLPGPVTVTMAPPDARGVLTQMMHLRDPETGAQSWHLLLGPNAFRTNDVSHGQDLVRGGAGESGLRGVAHRVADDRYDAKHRLQALYPGNHKPKSGTYRRAIAEATFVHELGHGLHTAQDPSQWLRVQDHSLGGTQATSITAQSAPNVSHYATNNGLEFVAEVFTAHVYGETFPNDVRAEYAEWGGPQSTRPPAPRAPLPADGDHGDSATREPGQNPNDSTTTDNRPGPDTRDTGSPHGSPARPGREVPPLDPELRAKLDETPWVERRRYRQLPSQDSRSGLVPPSEGVPRRRVVPGRPFGEHTAFDVRRAQVGDQGVTEVRVVVRVNPEPGSTADPDAVWAEASKGVDDYFNSRDLRLPNGDQLRVRIERAVGDQPAHHEVRITESGRNDQRNWRPGQPGLVYAHEIGHMIGLPDEYNPSGDADGLAITGTLMGGDTTYRDTDGTIRELPGIQTPDRYMQVLDQHVGDLSAGPPSSRTTAAEDSAGGQGDRGGPDRSRAEDDASRDLDAPPAPGSRREQGVEERERELSRKYHTRIGPAPGTDGKHFSHSMLDKIDTVLEGLPPLHVRDNPFLDSIVRSESRSGASHYNLDTNSIEVVNPGGMPSWLYTRLNRGIGWQRWLMDLGPLSQYEGLGTRDTLRIGGERRHVMAGVSDVLAHGNLVEWTLRHEVAHSVDNAHDWLENHAHEDRFGGWAMHVDGEGGHELSSVVDAVVTKIGMTPEERALTDRSGRTTFSDALTAALDPERARRDPGELSRLTNDYGHHGPEVRTKVQQAVDFARAALRQPWTLDDGGGDRLTVDGRIYQVSPHNQWVSYQASARDHAVSNYQFSDPMEWFAEAYAAYHDPTPGPRAALTQEARDWFEHNAREATPPGSPRLGGTELAAPPAPPPGPAPQQTAPDPQTAQGNQDPVANSTTSQGDASNPGTSPRGANTAESPKPLTDGVARHAPPGEDRASGPTPEHRADAIEQRQAREPRRAPLPTQRASSAPPALPSAPSNGRAPAPDAPDLGPDRVERAAADVEGTGAPTRQPGEPESTPESGAEASSQVVADQEPPTRVQPDGSDAVRPADHGPTAELTSPEATTNPEQPVESQRPPAEPGAVDDSGSRVSDRDSATADEARGGADRPVQEGGSVTPDHEGVTPSGRPDLADGADPNRGPGQQEGSAQRYPFETVPAGVVSSDLSSLVQSNKDFSEFDAGQPAPGTTGSPSGPNPLRGSAEESSSSPFGTVSLPQRVVHISQLLDEVRGQHNQPEGDNPLTDSVPQVVGDGSAVSSEPVAGSVSQETPTKPQRDLLPRDLKDAGVVGPEAKVRSIELDQDSDSARPSNSSAEGGKSAGKQPAPKQQLTTLLDTLTAGDQPKKLGLSAAEGTTLRTQVHDLVRREGTVGALRLLTDGHLFQFKTGNNGPVRDVWVRLTPESVLPSPDEPATKSTTEAQATDKAESSREDGSTANEKDNAQEDAGDKDITADKGKEAKDKEAKDKEAKDKKDEGPKDEVAPGTSISSERSQNTQSSRTLMPFTLRAATLLQMLTGAPIMVAPTFRSTADRSTQDSKQRVGTSSRTVSKEGDASLFDVRFRAEVQVEGNGKPKQSGVSLPGKVRLSYSEMALRDARPGESGTTSTSGSSTGSTGEGGTSTASDRPAPAGQQATAGNSGSGDTRTTEDTSTKDDKDIQADRDKDARTDKDGRSPQDGRTNPDPAEPKPAVTLPPALLDHIVSVDLVSGLGQVRADVMRKLPATVPVEGTIRRDAVSRINSAHLEKAGPDALVHGLSTSTPQPLGRRTYHQVLPDVSTTTTTRFRGFQRHDAGEAALGHEASVTGSQSNEQGRSSGFELGVEVRGYGPGGELSHGQQMSVGGVGTVGFGASRKTTDSLAYNQAFKTESKIDSDTTLFVLDAEFSANVTATRFRGVENVDFTVDGRKGTVHVRVRSSEADTVEQLLGDALKDQSTATGKSGGAEESSTVDGAGGPTTASHPSGNSLTRTTGQTGHQGSSDRATADRTNNPATNPPAANGGRQANAIRWDRLSVPLPLRKLFGARRDTPMTDNDQSTDIPLTPITQPNQTGQTGAETGAPAQSTGDNRTSGTDGRRNDGSNRGETGDTQQNQPGTGEDSGTTAVDTGAGGEDSGTTAVDTGAGGENSGTTGVDTGATGENTGTTDATSSTSEDGAATTKRPGVERQAELRAATEPSLFNHTERVKGAHQALNRARADIEQRLAKDGVDVDQHVRAQITRSLTSAISQSRIEGDYHRIAVPGGPPLTSTVRVASREFEVALTATPDTDPTNAVHSERSVKEGEITVTPGQGAGIGTKVQTAGSQFASFMFGFRSRLSGHHNLARFLGGFHLGPRYRSEHNHGSGLTSTTSVQNKIKYKGPVREIERGGQLNVTITEPSNSKSDKTAFSVPVVARHQVPEFQVPTDGKDNPQRSVEKSSPGKPIIDPKDADLGKSSLEDGIDLTGALVTRPITDLTTINEALRTAQQDVREKVKAKTSETDTTMVVDAEWLFANQDRLVGEGAVLPHGTQEGVILDRTEFGGIMLRAHGATYVDSPPGLTPSEQTTVDSSRKQTSGSSSDTTMNVNVMVTPVVGNAGKTWSGEHSAGKGYGAKKVTTVEGVKGTVYHRYRADAVVTVSAHAWQNLFGQPNQDGWGRRQFFGYPMAPATKNVTVLFPNALEFVVTETQRQDKKLPEPPSTAKDDTAKTTESGTTGTKKSTEEAESPEQTTTGTEASSARKQSDGSDTASDGGHDAQQPGPSDTTESAKQGTTVGEGRTDRRGEQAAEHVTDATDATTSTTKAPASTTGDTTGTTPENTPEKDDRNSGKSDDKASTSTEKDGTTDGSTATTESGKENPGAGTRKLPPYIALGTGLGADTALVSPEGLKDVDAALKKVIAKVTPGAAPFVKESSQNPPPIGVLARTSELTAESRGGATVERMATGQASVLHTRSMVFQDRTYEYRVIAREDPSRDISHLGQEERKHQSEQATSTPSEKGGGKGTGVSAAVGLSYMFGETPPEGPPPAGMGGPVFGGNWSKSKSVSRTDEAVDKRGDKVEVTKVERFRVPLTYEIEVYQVDTPSVFMSKISGGHSPHVLNSDNYRKPTTRQLTVPEDLRTVPGKVDLLVPHDDTLPVERTDGDKSGSTPSEGQPKSDGKQPEGKSNGASSSSTAPPNSTSAQGETSSAQGNTTSSGAPSSRERMPALERLAKDEKPSGKNYTDVLRKATTLRVRGLATDGLADHVIDSAVRTPNKGGDPSHRTERLYGDATAERREIRDLASERQLSAHLPRILSGETTYSHEVVNRNRYRTAKHTTEIKPKVYEVEFDGSRTVKREISSSSGHSTSVSHTEGRVKGTNSGAMGSNSNGSAGGSGGGTPGLTRRTGSSYSEKNENVSGEKSTHENVTLYRYRADVYYDIVNSFHKRRGVLPWQWDRRLVSPVDITTTTTVRGRQGLYFELTEAEAKELGLPTEKKPPVEQQKPVEQAAPVEQRKSAEQQGPVEQAAPVEQQKPVEQRKSAEQQGPVEQKSPPDEPESPAVEPEGPAVEQQAPAVDPEAPAAESAAPVVVPEVSLVGEQGASLAGQQAAVQSEGPVVGQQVPAVDAGVSAVESAAVVESGVPAFESEGPVVGQQASAVDAEASAVESAAPVVEPPATAPESEGDGPAG
ncbi:hypothetical protein, partial [Actinoalloteichus spitiensis]|uniref:hypothetical protein n=1 Tax=Actinoalloteichus spitiensis TaxID=252394 RepID=UPI00059352F1